MTSGGGWERDEAGRPTSWRFANQSRCAYRWFDTHAARACLAGKSVVIAGNSVSRHLMFVLHALLEGAPEFDYWSTSLADAERKKEKELCPKEFNETRGGLGSSATQGTCYGLCSCSSRSGSTDVHFVWQTRWFDEYLNRTYARLVSEPRRAFVTVNAGLNVVWESGYNFNAWAPPMLAQLGSLRAFFSGVRLAGRPVWRASTQSCTPEIDLAMQVQDPYIHAQLGDAWEFLDLRSPTTGRLGYSDCNHHPGIQAKTHVNMLLNLWC